MDASRRSHRNAKAIEEGLASVAPRRVISWQAGRQAGGQAGLVHKSILVCRNDIVHRLRLTNIVYIYSWKLRELTCRPKWLAYDLNTVL